MGSNYAHQSQLVLYQNPQAHTHTHPQSPRRLSDHPRTARASWVINVSVIRGSVRGTGRGQWGAAARLRADISGRGVSDVSRLLPGGGRGGRGSGSAQSSELGERSLLSLVWLIRQEAECPRCHYQYPWPPAARTAYAVGVTHVYTEETNTHTHTHTHTPRVFKHSWLGGSGLGPFAH